MTAWRVVAVLAALLAGGYLLMSKSGRDDIVITLGGDEDLPADELARAQAAFDAAQAKLREKPPVSRAPSAPELEVPADEVQPLFRTPRPADDGRPHALSRVTELACNACHADIVAEWSRSLHALAWVDERYQEAMQKKRKPESCQGCHIPEPIFAGAIGRRYAPRADVATPRPADGDAALAWDPRHFGVSCVSCHLAPDGAMLGPRASSPEDEISPGHASRQDDAFLRGGEFQDVLCLNCHRTNVGPVIGIAKDYELTDQAAKGLSCIGCHYAPVERPMARGTADDGTEWEGPVREGRSHALQTPRDPYYMSLAFGYEARATSRGAELVIKNQAAHRVPGLRTRSVTFEVVALDSRGAELARAEHRVASDDYLAVDDQVRVPLTFDGPARELRIRGVHDWEGMDEPLEFVDKALPLE